MEGFIARIVAEALLAIFRLAVVELLGWFRGDLPDGARSSLAL